MFLYWGRRGLSELVYDMAIQENLGFSSSVSISTANELFGDFARLGDRVAPVETFASNIGALTGLPTIPRLRRRLVEDLKSREVTDVVAVMPHVWMPLIVPAIRKAGVRFHTIIHDAAPHPGDRTALALPLLLLSVRQADRVFTLSHAVASRLVADGRIEADRISVLFHPDLTFGASQPAEPLPREPWRLLFLGRIQAYKGLSLLVEAVRLLRRQGYKVHLGVYGEGDIRAEAQLLRELNAHVVNRWLTTAEMQNALTTHHAVVLPYIEASQSGVAAAALGHGVPIVATPVTGLLEQVGAAGLGVIAQRCDAPALAEAIRSLFADESVTEGVRRNIVASQATRGTAAFMRSIVARLAEDAAAGGKAR